MNDSLAHRVRAAAGAGWWTALVAIVWMTVSWLAWLAVLAAQPAWVLAFWGGRGVTWATIQNVAIWFFGVMKITVLICVLITVWLTLWSRRLRRAEP